MIIAVLLAAGLILYIMSIRERKTWSEGLSLKLGFLTPFVYCRENADFTETVRNEKKKALPLLEAGFRLPKGLTFIESENMVESDYLYKRDIFSVLGNEQILRRYRVHCGHRGIYEPSQIYLKGFSPLSSRNFEIKDDMCCGKCEPFYVYAANVNVRDILRHTMSVLGEKETQRRLFEDPFSFASIRSYTPQDPMKTINWKATARTGELMVNTYNQSDSVKITLYLDVEDKRIVKEQKLIEEAVAVAASLMRQLQKQNAETGLHINTGLYFEPKRGHDHLTGIERALCRDFSKDDTVPLIDMLKDIPDDTVPVIVTKQADEALLSSIDSLMAGAGQKAVMVVPYFAGSERPSYISGHLTVIAREVSR